MVRSCSPNITWTHLFHGVWFDFLVVHCMTLIGGKGHGGGHNELGLGIRHHIHIKTVVNNWGVGFLPKWIGYVDMLLLCFVGLILQPDTPDYSDGVLFY